MAFIGDGSLGCLKHTHLKEYDIYNIVCEMSCFHTLSNVTRK